jgi:uncharacterized protein
VFRERALLFLQHPGLSWNGADALSAGILAALVLAASLAPGLLLLPVHYWSLLRSRRGRTGGWITSRWGLRETWLMLGLLLIADFAATWILAPEILHTWFTDVMLEEEIPTSRLLRAQLIFWIVAVLLAVLLLARGRAWSHLRGGTWSLWKSIGLGLGGALALKTAVLVTMILWPQAIELPQFASLPSSTQLCLDLMHEWGPVALIGTAGIMVPVLEEVLFRGVLLQGMAKHISFGVANTLQALAFAAVHWELALVPFYFTFGILCGVYTRRSGGLLPAILMHGCNNLLACIALLRLTRFGAI